MRRATRRCRIHQHTALISIHALREEGDARLSRVFRASLRISIHALREEGDNGSYKRCEPSNISIHALREEGDHDLRGHTALI